MPCTRERRDLRQYLRLLEERAPELLERVPAEVDQADFGLAETAPVLQAVGKGAAVKAFAVYMDESTSGPASLKRYGDAEPIAGKPIAGKKVAASLTDSARVIAPIPERLAGRDPSRIDWITADPSVYFPLLVQGPRRPRHRLHRLGRSDLEPDPLAAGKGGALHVLRRAGLRRLRLPPRRPGGRHRFEPRRGRRLREGDGESGSLCARSSRGGRVEPRRSSPTLDRELILAQWRVSMPAFESASTDEHGYGRGHRRAARAQHRARGARLRARVRAFATDLYVEVLAR